MSTLHTKNEKKTLTMNALVCFLGLALMFTATFAPLTVTRTGFATHTANAQVYRVVEVGKRLSDGAATLSSVMGILGVNQSVATKELTLDGIAYKLMQEVLAKQTSDMLNQIISGDNGAPLFIQSPNRMLSEASDIAFETFINGNALDGVCAPIKSDLQQSLDLQYQRSKGGVGSSGSADKFSCTMDAQDQAAFLNGQHVSGTWNKFHSLTMKPENNIFGQKVLRQYEANRRIEAAQREQSTIADWGNGFKSKQECQTVNGQTVCNITLPGKLALERAADVLNLGDQALLQADEINEVISSLLSRLGTEAFKTGVNGLLGLADNTDGSGSFLDNLANNTSDVTGVSDRSQNPIQLALNAERAVIGQHNAIRASIDAIRAKFNSPTINADVNCPDLSFPQELNRQYASSTRVTADGASIVSALEDLNRRYNAATNATEQLAVYSEFLNLDHSGFIANIVDVALVPLRAEEIDQIIATFSAQIDRECVVASDRELLEGNLQSRGGGGGN